jgi:hypothetical protein
MLWVLGREMWGWRGLRREFGEKVGVKGEMVVGVLLVCTCLGRLSTVWELCAETLLGGLPVDDIPDGGEILCLAVLVLQIVLDIVSLAVAHLGEDSTYSMFPSIDTQQRLILANNRILVSVCADANLARLRVLDKPGPSTALNARQRSIELLLHLI